MRLSHIPTFIRQSMTSYTSMFNSIKITPWIQHLKNRVFSYQGGIFLSLFFKYLLKIRFKKIKFEFSRIKARLFWNSAKTVEKF